MVDIFGQAASREEEEVEWHRKLASRTVSNGFFRNAVRSAVHDPINSTDRDREGGGGVGASTT